METKFTPKPWMINHDKRQSINAQLMIAGPDMYEALRFVQEALANFRDGKDYTEHPEHGKLTLEEVKYCVVDPAINKALGSD